MTVANLVLAIGAPQIILIVVVVLLLFGGRKIPELMRGLGQVIREFNNAKANIESEVKDSMKELEEKKKEKQRSGPITRND